MTIPTKGRIYRQFVHRIETVDGDTFRALVDFGWRLPPWPITLRLHGVDTPELHGEHKAAGLRVRQLVLEWLERANGAAASQLAELSVLSASIDLYGRSLGDIEVREHFGTRRTLSQWLLVHSLAKATSPDGKRPEWSARELLAIMESNPKFPDFSLPVASPSARSGQ